MAKTVNFGVLYGMSARGLAQRLGIPQEEAARFIDAYFARYPKVQEYQTKLLANGRRQRYVSTILGRRREITGIRERSAYQQRNQPEREAVNMEIQGSAADLIKMAMLNIYRRLRSEKRQARLLLQIHDELVFEAPPDEVDDVAALVVEEMTTRLEKDLKLEVPLKVDIAAGPNGIMKSLDAHRTDRRHLVWASGTLSGNPISATAGLTALDLLSRPGTYDHLHKIGGRLRREIPKIGARYGFAAQTPGEDAVFGVRFTNREPLRTWEDLLTADKDLNLRWSVELLRRGILVNPNEKFYISVAHTDADVDRTLEACDQAFATIAR